MQDDECIEMFVVYELPLDYPLEYVVRRHVVRGGGHTPDPGEPMIRELTLDAARDKLLEARPFLSNLGRFPEDDPKIKEVWI